MFSDLSFQGICLALFIEPNKKFCLEIDNEGICNVIYSCPLDLIGQGDLKIALSWRGEEVVIYAGGLCVASTDPSTTAVDVAHLVLKP